MVRKITILLMLALSPILAFNQTTFIKEYSSTDFSGGTNLVGPSPGQIIDSYVNGDVLLGYSIHETIAGTVYGGLAFAKLDTDGNIIWRKKFLNSTYVSKYNIIASVQRDDEFYITGHEEGVTNGNKRIPFVLKIEGSNGNLIWNQQYTTSADEITPRDIIFTSNDSLLVVGVSDKVTGVANGESALFKVSAGNGGLAWIKTYDIADNLECKTVCENSAGEFVLFFETASTKLGILRTDANGTYIPGSALEYTIPNFTNAYPNDVYYDPSLGYTLLIQDDNLNHGLMRFDLGLNFQWARQFSPSVAPGIVIGGQLQKVVDGFLISGLGDFGSNKKYLLKANNSGDFLWLKSLDLSTYDSYNSQHDFIATDEGIFVPFITTPGVSGNPLKLIKTNLLGNLLATDCSTEEDSIVTVVTLTHTAVTYSITEVTLTATTTSPYSFTDPNLTATEICSSACTDPFGLFINSGNDSLCEPGFPVTLVANTVGSPSAYTYFWSDGSTGSSLVVNSSGTYSVTVENDSGCLEMATVIVGLAPDVQATQPELSLCCASGEITLGAEYIPTGNVYWTNDYFTPVDGFSPSIGPIGGEFTVLPPCVTTEVIGDFRLYKLDPCSCPLGVQTVEYTYTDPNSGCSGSAIMEITIEDEYWHQTTSSTAANTPGPEGDNSKDIYVDDKGYIYATGSFYKQTTFNDGLGNSITVVSPNSDEKSFYTVCYNECGELQWTIHDQSGGTDAWSEGFGVIREYDRRILVGINYNVNTLLITSYPSGTTVTSTVNGSAGTSNLGNMAIIAVQSETTANFGEIDLIDDSHPHFFGTAIDAEILDNGDKHFYTCGKSDTDQNGLNKAFCAGFNYTFPIISIAGIWDSESNQESVINVANDIKFDIYTDQLMVTGTFDENLSFGGLAALNTTATSDAFILHLFENTGGTISNLLFDKLGVASSGWAIGTCLSSNDGGYLYFGGDYSDEVGSPFLDYTGGALSTLAMNSTTNSSYIFGNNENTTSFDMEEIFNMQSYTKLTGMDANDEELNFVGHYDRGLPEIVGTVATNNVAGGGQHYLFVGEVEITASNWNTSATITNSTFNGAVLDYNHVSSRISMGENFTYLTGNYVGNMDYTFGTPASGPLNSTALLGVLYNAFFMRHDIANNELRSPVLSDSKDLTSLSQELNVSIYPNPTVANATIHIEGATEGAVSIELFTLTGAQVGNFNTANGTFNLDLTNYENGTYIIRVTSNDQVKILKLIKSH